MSFSIKNYIKESFKELIFSGYLLLGIISGILPAVAIATFILNNPDSEFFIKHVSNFYCMIGLLGAVINSLHMINRDFSTNVISLINNRKKNRKRYVIANLLVSIIIAVIYAIIGVGLCYICKYCGVPGEMTTSFVVGFFANLIFLIPTYFLICYVIYLIGGKSGVVYGILTGSLLFLPNILANVLDGMKEGIVKSVIENCPIYYYPIYAGSNPLGAQKYLIGVVVLVLCFAFVIKQSLKYDK